MIRSQARWVLQRTAEMESTRRTFTTISKYYRVCGSAVQLSLRRFINENYLA